MTDPFAQYEPCLASVIEEAQGARERLEAQVRACGEIGSLGPLEDYKLIISLGDARTLLSSTPVRAEWSEADLSEFRLRAEPESHPILKAMIDVRHRTAGTFTPEHSGQRGEDFDRGLLAAFNAARDALIAAPAPVVGREEIARVVDQVMHKYAMVGANLHNAVDRGLVATKITDALLATKSQPAPAVLVSHHDRHPWCQPGDRAERLWLLRFDDPDQREQVFDDEAEARAAYTKYSPTWNCYLLASVEAKSKPAGEVERLRAELEAIRDWEPDPDIDVDPYQQIAGHARRAARNALTTPSAVGEPEPIPMLLYCPKCGAQHVDEPDERTPGWTNPPHCSHLCHRCGCIWRPADVATVGVATIQTKGKADTWTSPDLSHTAGVGVEARCPDCGAPTRIRTDRTEDGPERVAICDACMWMGSAEL